MHSFWCAVSWMWLIQNVSVGGKKIKTKHSILKKNWKTQCSKLQLDFDYKWAYTSVDDRRRFFFFYTKSSSGLILSFGCPFPAISVKLTWGQIPHHWSRTLLYFLCESNSGFNILEPRRGLWDGGRQRASAGLLHRPKPQSPPESRYEKR